jgi:hypothetical protein
MKLPNRLYYGAHLEKGSENEQEEISRFMKEDEERLLY